MRLVSYEHNGKASFGLVVGEGIVDLAKRTGVSSLRELLAAGKLADAAKYADEKADIPVKGVKFLPVITDPKHVYCLAVNYAAHAKEVSNIGIQRDVPAKPSLFMRYADTLIGHGQPIIKPHVSDSLDYEGELAVIIGKAGRYVSEADAMDYVAGYSVFNDGSVRDWQFHTRQLAPGKNFFATGALGPYLVTKDEVSDPHNLRVVTKLNGAVLQNGNTSDMVHKIPAFVSYVSSLLPLVPGDILATGTPDGVGFSRKPPIFMKVGDTCEIEIEKVGTLVSPIGAE